MIPRVAFIMSYEGDPGAKRNVDCVCFSSMMPVVWSSFKVLQVPYEVEDSSSSSHFH